VLQIIVTEQVKAGPNKIPSPQCRFVFILQGNILKAILGSFCADKDMLKGLKTTTTFN
jgi:hypothetical protein